MSAPRLDTLLSERWSEIIKVANTELDSWRSLISLELLVERIQVPADALSVELLGGERAKPIVLPGGGRRWDPSIRPVWRFGTSTVVLNEEDLRSAEGQGRQNRRSAIQTLMTRAMTAEHELILTGTGEGEKDDGITSAAMQGPLNPARYRPTSYPSDNQAESHRPEFWMHVRSKSLERDGSPVADTIVQHIGTPLLPSAKKGYAMRYTGERPIVIHEAVPWHLVRLPDNYGVVLGLESRWSIEHRVEGTDLEVHRLD